MRRPLVICGTGAQSEAAVAAVGKARVTSLRGSQPTALPDAAPLEHINAWEAERRALLGLKCAVHEPIMSDGSSLVSALAIHDTSLWWFIEPLYHRFRFRALTLALERLRFAAEQERPTRIVGWAIPSELHPAFAVASRSLGIPFQLDGPPTAFPARALSSRWSLLIARDVARWLAAPRNLKTAPTARPVLCTSMSREKLVIRSGEGLVADDLILSPLLDALEQDSDRQTVFLYKFPHSRQVRLQRGPCRRRMTHRVWEQHWSLRAGWYFVRKRAWLRRQCARLQGATAPFQDLTVAGFRVGPQAFALAFPLLRWEATQALRFLSLADRIVDEVNPEVVVAASEMSLDTRALVVAARRRSIPVIALQHGTILPTDDYLAEYLCTDVDFGIPSKDWVLPDRLCVFGEGTASVLVDDIGHPFPERISVTGQPRFDVLMRPDASRIRTQVQLYFRLDPNRPTVLVAGQTFNIAGDPASFYDTVLASYVSDWNLVFKPHPLESTNDLVNRCRDAGVPATVLPPAFDTHAALLAADVLIGFYSTVITEAIVAGLPVVVLNTTAGPDPKPFVRQGVAVSARCSAELRAAVSGCLSDPDAASPHSARVAFLRREVGSPVGGATRRVLGLILRDARLSGQETP